MSVSNAAADVLELLDDRVESLERALAAKVCPDGVLWDPVARAPTPADHYGQLACAVALRVCQPEAPEGRRAERAWLQVPSAKLSHAPFNRFLLLLLSQIDKEQRPLSRCPLERRYPSNNWSVLAQLCRLLEADGSRNQRREDALLRRILLAWMTDSGGFIDYPAEPSYAGPVSTPLAYHHKAFFVAAFAARQGGDSNWLPILTKLLAWTQLSWDGGGCVGGFGRSNHALFGDACLIGALLLLGAGQSSQSGSPYEQILVDILRRWQAQERDDGLLWLTPADGVAQAPTGWDEYMHLSVYNAWTAAILGWARAITASTECPPLFRELVLPAIAPARQADPVAGLFRTEISRRDEGGSDCCALLSTRGQPPQAFRRSEIEFRYSGGLLFHLRAGRRKLLPPPVRVSVESLLQQPALAGWVPVFKVGNALYGLTDYDSIEISDASAELTLTAVGSPRALTRQPAHGLAERLLEALDWRLLGGRLGRRHALRRPILSGIVGRLQLMLDLEHLQLFYHLELRNTHTKTVRYLNPAGHALTTDTLPAQHRATGSGAVSVEMPMMETCPLPATLPNGQGYALPSATLARGRSSYGIELGWPFDGSD